MTWAWKYKGVKRRFEVIGVRQNITVIDDYAHHPTEIIATLQAAKSVCKSNNKRLVDFNPIFCDIHTNDVKEIKFNYDDIADPIIFDLEDYNTNE